MLAVSWLLGVHLVALVVLLVSPFDFFLVSLSIAGLLASFVHGWKSCVTHSLRDMPSTLVWQSGDRLQLVLASGAVRPARLLRQALVLPWLVVLHYRVQDRTRRLAVFADMPDPDGWRRLRVRLRLMLSTSPDSEAH